MKKTTSEMELIPVDKLVPYVNNARTHSAKQINKLRASMREFGFINPVIVDRDFNVIAGHGRIIAAQEEGIKEVPCVYVDFLTEAQRKAYILADNRIALDADWDEETLRVELEALKLEDFDFSFTGFDEQEFEDLSSAIDASYQNLKRINLLEESFITPPFSILDTRSGKWTQRERSWNEILISKRGRAEALLGGLKGLECQSGSKKASGTSVFNAPLCEILYQWFCPAHGRILDPFAGGSVRGLVASFLDKPYTGLDLSQTQINANIEQYEKIKELKSFGENDLQKPEWICADAKTISNVANGKYDFLISCPPYYDLEHYSDDPNDLSNMTWDDFKTAYRQIFKDAVSLLKDDSFVAVVVGEVRSKNGNGKYLNFAGETISALENAGADYYNEMILVNNVFTARLRARRQFEASRKVAKVHQNVLVFVKGDAKRATQKLDNNINWFKDVETDEDDSSEIA